MARLIIIGIFIGIIISLKYIFKQRAVCFECGKTRKLQSVLIPNKSNSYFYYHTDCLRKITTTPEKYSRKIINTSHKILDAQKFNAEKNIEQNAVNNELKEKYRERQWDSMLNR